MKATIKSLREYTDFDSAYWGMGVNSDGKVYFGLCSHMPGKSAGLFSVDMATDVIEHLFNVDDILGSAHGKIHTPIVEGTDEKMYFGTHFAYPHGDPTQPVQYEGGHIMSYDPNTKTVEDFGIVQEKNGVLTVAMDKGNNKLYALTIPSGHLMCLDISSRIYRDLGAVPSNGSICRTITIGDNGKVYGSFEEDGLFIYDPVTDELTLKPNYFPAENVDEWGAASRGGVNKVGRKLWRCATYDAGRNALYGIYSTSSRAFVIDCATLELGIFDPMVPSDFNEATNVYPTLSLVADDERLLYVPADGMFDYCRSDNMREMSHLMAFNKAHEGLEDLGEITDGDHKIYGVAGAVLNGDALLLLGATESDADVMAIGPEDKLFNINGQPFELSLIKVTL